jgi:hypothetical protein
MNLTKQKASGQDGFTTTHDGQEATVIDLRKESDALASCPVQERLRALQRITSRARKWKRYWHALATTGGAAHGCRAGS